MGSFLPTTRNPLDPAPERLVGLGFRCAMTCLRPGSGLAAPQACALLKAAIEAHRLPTKLNRDFAAWALAVDATAERPIALSALDHQSFTPDESLAIALVAACQHAHCPALTACASALLGTHDLGRALAATQILAHTLFTANALLSPSNTETDASTNDQSNLYLRVH
jgi:hypothetical protein